VFYFKNKKRNKFEKIIFYFEVELKDMLADPDPRTPKLQILSGSKSKTLQAVLHSTPCAYDVNMQLFPGIMVYIDKLFYIAVSL